MGFKIAVAGATGNVGREMLNILSERGFPADEVVALVQEGKVRHTVKPIRFEEVNETLDLLREGEVVGRAVIKY